RRLHPRPRFETGQTANVPRIFERGARFRPAAGLPTPQEESGRPILPRLSTRGLGTQNRVEPALVGLQKTRLLDPTLNFLGTNDHPGDYRSSGCSGCHLVYANDRSRVHSGPYAVFGNGGQSFSDDPTLPPGEPGHPIKHRFAPGNSIPTSQCLICPMHPRTHVLHSYDGPQVRAGGGAGGGGGGGRGVAPPPGGKTPRGRGRGGRGLAPPPRRPRSEIPRPAGPPGRPCGPNPASPATPSSRTSTATAGP